MSYSFNNNLVLNINADYHRHGLWSADCSFATDPKVGTKGTLKIDDFSCVGTVVNSTLIGPGNFKVRIVCGNGAMSEATTAQNLTETSAINVINKLINSTETIGNIPSLVSSYKLKQWEILNGVPRGKQVSRLLSQFENHVWRINSEGSFIITDDSATGNTVMPSKAVLMDSIGDGSKIYRVSNLDKMPEVGSVTSDGYVIEQINLSADNKGITLTIMKESLAKAFDVLTSRPHRDSLQRCYPCRVDGQNSDGEQGTLGGTLKVFPDDPRIQGRGLDKVPIRGIPGALYTIPRGARCFIQFDVDDPSKPFVSGFETNNFSSFSGAGDSEYFISFGNPSSSQFLALANLVNARFEALESKVDDHINLYNGHIHVTTATIGATATPGVLSPTVSVDTPVIPGSDVDCVRLKSE